MFASFYPILLNFFVNCNSFRRLLAFDLEFDGVPDDLLSISIDYLMESLMSHPMIIRPNFSKAPENLMVCVFPLLLRPSFEG